MHGLDLMLGNIARDLAERKKQGVLIEDNFSAHKTDEVMEFWKERLPSFSEPRFIPAKQSSRIQVIDRHCGIQYKVYCYLMYRKELIRRLEVARAKMTEQRA